MNAKKPPSAAGRAHAAMQHLILDQDRRREVADATGMSFFRTKALRRLVAGPARMTDLAARLETDKPYLTVVVDDLERRGLVTRSVAEDDRRCKVVAITEAGQAVAAQADEILSRPSKGLSALDADEMATLARLLEKAVDAAGGSAGAGRSV
jgi:DNA-binding MarR family transcriptional regulator